MTSKDKKPDVDKASGVETTGHEWDGLKELNNPLPRWWLWTFIITCIWAFGYMFVYPTWPTLSGEGVRGGTPGSAGWTQYRQLKEQQADIVARKSAYLERFTKSDFESILEDPELYQFAIAGGKAAFKENCSQCHGTGGGGAKGYPNLNDDEWIWGGSLEDIYSTLVVGIRSGHEDEKTSMMPNFGEDGILNKEQMRDVAQYVYALSHKENLADAATLQRGAGIFKEQCAACHADDGRGMREMGAPSLNDAVWLYGDGEVNSIMNQLQRAKHGVMPYWEGRLSNETIRQLTIYVHSLGGGEASRSPVLEIAEPEVLETAPVVAPAPSEELPANE